MKKIIFAVTLLTMGTAAYAAAPNAVMSCCSAIAACCGVSLPCCG